MIKKLSERLIELRRGIPDLECDELATFDEAADLAKRIEDAPIVTVYSERLQKTLKSLDGKRVAIVPVEEEGE